MSMEDCSAGLQAYSLCLGFVPSMVAKAVCELGVLDILGAHPHQPMSAFDIAQRLSPPPTRPLHAAAQQLDRMMRCLSAYNVFQAHVEPAPADNPQAATARHDVHTSSVIKYSSTPVSKWLATSQAFLLLEMSSSMQAPWHHLSQSLLHGFPPFTAAHSMDVWALTASSTPFNRLVHSGMTSASHISLLALLRHYDGFQNEALRTLVDVGGGTGTVASFIASHYPSIKTINFDVPLVVAAAPVHPGVQHIGGDMFQSIPPGDAILLKWVLHDWDDEDCVKILKNCHKVLPRHGKLIIMEAVLDSASVEESPFHKIRVALDMVMLAHTTNGKERTKTQWEALLVASNFELHQIIDLPCPQCVIEAIPL